MSEQLHIHTAIAAITCDSCRNVSAGDQVDIFLRDDLLPALPASIRGIVQLVTGFVYTIQYETDDLLGVIALLSDEFVDSVSCVSELTLAQEYSDGQDALQNLRITNIEDSLSALGVIPSDGDSRFIVHPASTPGVSVEVIRHDKVMVEANVGVETVIVTPESMLTALALLSGAGMRYRMEFSVSVISQKVTDNRDSSASFVMVGAINQGASYDTVHLMEDDGVTIVASKVVNAFHITVTNPSSADVDVFVTTKFRLLS